MEYKIYISSTKDDLEEWRKTAVEVVLRMKQMPVAMEHYNSTNKRPLDQCLKDVRDCDIFIGIYAFRYGYVPDGCNKSITHLEYEEARKNNKHLLLFVIDETVRFAPKDIDDNRTDIMEFRAIICKELLVTIIKDKNEFDGKLSTSIHGALDTIQNANLGPGLKLKESDSVVTGPVVGPSGKPPEIGEYHKYTCDRTQQHDQFTKRDKRQGGKVHFFCLHGWEEQSPKGLASRFNFELRKKITDSLRAQDSNDYNADIQVINVNDSYDKELFKAKLIQTFFKHFNLDSDKFGPITKSNLGVVCNNSPLLLKGNSGIETVYLRIDPEEWREFIPEVLDWFVNTFCTEDFIPVSAPKFYFFISLIYGEEKEEEVCIDIREKILPAIKKIKGMLVFDEFVKVEKMHITKWLGKCLNDSTGKERREIFSKYFGDVKEDEYKMDEVEEGLGKIIEVLKETK